MAGQSPLPGSLFTDSCGSSCDSPVQRQSQLMGMFGGPTRTIRLAAFIDGILQPLSFDETILSCYLEGMSMIACCPETNQLLTDIKNQFVAKVVADVEWIALCDTPSAGAEPVPFFNRIVTVFNPDGSVAGTAVTQWAADQVTAYTIQGAVGACPTIVPSLPGQRVLTYVSENTAVLSVADILAATGASRIESITVKQMAGNGKITGDTGVVDFSVGETWSWSISGTELAQDTLSSSGMQFDAGGGTQRITATYVV
jgi:hypothetical protein